MCEAIDNSEFHENVLEEIRAEKEQLFSAALKEKNSFEASVQKIQRTKLHPVVRRCNGAPTISWKRDGHLCKGRQEKYPGGTFKSEPDAVRELAIQYEHRFYQIRRQVKFLTEMESLLKKKQKEIRL